MESDIGTEVSSSIFIHSALSGGFHEMNSLARKRDLTWQSSGLLYNHHQQKNHRRTTDSPRQNAGNWNPNSWNWDSARFIAKPASNSSDKSLRIGNSSPADETEQNLGFAKTSEKRENLTLNLGGLSHAFEDQTERSNKRVCSGSPGSYPMCQVDDCKADLSSAKDYHRRHKVCEVHSKTSKAVVGNQMQRFCQQCSRFHSLGEFDEGKRSCRRRLAGHNRRRRKTQPKENSPHLAFPPIQDNLKIADVLSIIARLQGHGVDKSNGICLPIKEIIDPPVVLSSSPKFPKYGNFDLNVSEISLERSSAPPTMDLLGVLAPSSGDSSDSSDDSKRKVNSLDSKIESSESSDHSVDENSPRLQLQLFSSPMEDRSPLSSSPLQRLFPLPSKNEASKSDFLSLSRNVNGVKEYGSLLELSRNSERICVSGETSSSGSDLSPSTSDSEYQDRTGRIIFKLFGKDPSSFPGTLRAQILSWLSHSPSDMESYIRPGCVVLSIYLSMPSFQWAQLERDLDRRVNALIQSTDSDFWRNARFMVHTANLLASHNNGKIRLCKSWITLRTPEIVSISPLAVVSGKETLLTLRGRNLTVPGTKFHCMGMGIYTSKTSDSNFYDDSTLETFVFPGGAPDFYGRCFLEVENAFKGNSFPVILADEKICHEIRVLEAELNDPMKRELVLHFLNELGWLLQRKSMLDFSLHPSFSCSRFRFLLVFSIDRDWTASVNEVLNCIIEETSKNPDFVGELKEMLLEIQLLHKAVKRKCRKMVDFLLNYSMKDEAGLSNFYIFPPNVAGPGGITPLHLAASMEDSQDIVDALTDDPQEIGLDSWNTSVDEDGLSPHSYALLKNNHYYNKLVDQKLDRRLNQISIIINAEEMIPEKPETPKPWSLKTIRSKCSIMEKRRIVSTHQAVGLRVPFMHPILAIAAVCVCVCVFLRGSPVFGSVGSPFRWENLQFGPS